MDSWDNDFLIRRLIFGANRTCSGIPYTVKFLEVCQYCGKDITDEPYHYCFNRGTKTTSGGDN